VFSVDLTSLMSYAIDFFNALFPVFIPVLGIILGLGLVTLIIRIIRSLLKGF
jgi:uncharacterized membrane protein YqaE (UPF0057 family)